MASRSLLVTPVLLTGCLIITVSFGIRRSFGLFQITIAEDLNRLRANFSLTLLVQNWAGEWASKSFTQLLIESVIEGLYWAAP